MTKHIHEGYLVTSAGRRWVGTTASAIQTVIDSFPAIGSGDVAGISYFDKRQLRYLDLSGGVYTVDTTLYLPSMFVLRLDGYDAMTGLVLDESPASSGDAYPSIIYFDNSKYSAVLGGFLNASRNSDYQAIHIRNGKRCHTPRPPHAHRGIAGLYEAILG